MNGDMALTGRRSQFAAEYLIDHNATQAAMRAGYSARTAYSQGARLLKNAEVQRAIAERGQKQLERLEITADDIARRAWEIANQDRGDRVAALALLAKRHPEFSDKIERVNPEEVWALAVRFGLDPAAVMAEAEEIVRGR